MLRNRKKLVIVVSHPIQHFVPFYRALAQEESIDLTVIYCSKIGVEPYFDKVMNTTIAWKMDLLGGYDHVFLPEADRIKSTGPKRVNNPSIGDELARQTPDVVLIYGYNYITSLRALFWCRRNGVPTMMISDSELKTRRSKRTELIKQLIVPRILRRFDAFLTVGDCNEDYYVRYGVPRDKLFRSPFTIDEDTYQAAYRNRSTMRAERRAELGLADDEVMVLTVAKLSPRKRPTDVIEVARWIKAAGNPAKICFVMAGSGEEMEQIKKAVDNERLPVLMAGFVNVNILPTYYVAADILFHPAGIEPFGLVVPEAAAVGLPLIISKAVGALGRSSPARVNENALVFSVGDIGEMAEKISTLAADLERRKRMSVRSRDIFKQLDMTCSVNGALDAIRFVTVGSRK